MNNHLTTAQLIEVMHTARSKWEALLTEAGAARLTEPGVEGHWSLKDIIAHITYFEVWATDNLIAIRRGDPRQQAEYTGLDVDEENARIYERNRVKSVAEVLSESQASFERSIEAVRGLRDEDLYDPEFTRKSGADWTVIELLEGDAYEHYQDHTTSVRAWLDRATTQQ